MAPSITTTEVILSKRIIVSGIAPNTTPDDLAARFKPFGTVKAADGFGMKDGNGDPRKFVFVTIETTEPKLARCMNTLNGTKWRGSTLKIGVAQPDYLDRVVAEKDKSLESSLHSMAIDSKGRPKKKRRMVIPGADGKQTGDMTPTSLDNVANRKHWKRTLLDHLIRPIRIRPDRPLPLTTDSVKNKAGTKRKQTKNSKSASRARRTVIDPTRYGAVHLTAASGMLGAEIIGYDVVGPKVLEGGQDRSNEDAPEGEGEEEDTEERPESEEEVSSEAHESEDGDIDEQDPSSDSEDESLSISQPPATSLPPDDAAPNVEIEKKRDLDILASLLGNSETLAWEPDSDLEELAKEHSDKKDAERNPQPTSNLHPSVLRDITKQPEASSSQSALKDMFAPRPDDAGFSLFDSLGDVDVELEEYHEPRPPRQFIRDQPDMTLPPTTIPSEFGLDPTAPFFFPLPRDEFGLVDLPGGRGTSGTRPRDLVDVLKTDEWRSSTGRDGFWRTETDEEIQKYFDSVKRDLIQQSQRRHKEALRRQKKHSGAPDSLSLTGSFV